LFGRGDGKIKAVIEKTKKGGLSGAPISVLGVITVIAVAGERLPAALVVPPMAAPCAVQ
jgi:hypothetical protein